MDTKFNAPIEALPASEVAANVKALDMPEGWTRADDLALVEGLFKFPGLFRVAVTMRRTLDDVQARFLVLRRAATGPKRYEFGITAQSRLLNAVRQAAERVEA